VIDFLKAMSPIDSAVKIRLGQLAEQCEELCKSEEWPAHDWPAKLEETRNRFDRLRGLAKQLLGQHRGKDFCNQTNPVRSAQPSRLEEKRTLCAAIIKAAEILRKIAAES
jgi:hypothetical protein